MALFENFPYTNLHDLNLDWVLATVRKLIAEWTAYQTAMNKNFADLSAAFDDLREYVNNYFDTLDVTEEVTEAVQNVLNEMIEDGTLENMISEYIAKIGVSGGTSINLVAEYLLDTMQAENSFVTPDNSPYEHAPQGGCYIGNGDFVQYVRTKPHTTGDDANNYGKLVKFNIRTGAMLYRTGPMLMYHGNTIAYKDGYIYVAGSIDSNNTSTGKVFKIAVNDLETYVQTFENIAGTNIAYDRVTDTFYAMGSKLTGESNKVYKYTGEFEGTPELITLENTRETQNLFTNFQNQGGMVHNNVFYGVYGCDLQGPGGFCVAAFDLLTTKLIRIWNIPYIWNHCKYAQELEALTYDFDNDEFLITSASLTQRLHNVAVLNVAQVGLYKTVIENLPAYATVDQLNAVRDVYVECGACRVGYNDCTPFYKRFYDTNNHPLFYSAYDAELYASVRGNRDVVRYRASDRVTGMPVFSTWRPHTNFYVKPVDGQSMRISLPEVVNQSFARFEGADAQHPIQLHGSGRDGGAGVLNVGYGCRCIARHVTILPSLDTVQYGIDIYSGGTLEIIDDVKWDPDADSTLTFIRLRDGGRVENARVIYDDAVTVNTAAVFTGICTSAGFLVLKFKLSATDNYLSTIAIDRTAAADNANYIKISLPAAGGIVRMNLSFTNTQVTITSAVFIEDGASSGQAITAIDRMIVTQYPFYPKHTLLA